LNASTGLRGAHRRQRRRNAQLAPAKRSGTGRESEYRCKCRVICQIAFTRFWAKSMLRLSSRKVVSFNSNEVLTQRTRDDESDVVSLNSVQPPHGLHPPPNAVKTSSGNGVPSGPGNAADSVRLSSQGRMLSKMTDIAPPSPGDVRKLSETLARELKSLFRENALDAKSGVVFEADPSSGKVGVKENRQDAREIAALIAAHPELERQIRAIAALSTHLFLSEQGADSRLANRMAQSAAQVSAFVTAHAPAFSQEKDAQAFSMIPGERSGSAAGISHAIAQYTATAGTSAATVDIAVIFTGADIQVHANGTPWLSSRA
jgi:hypothetical protein